MKFAFWNCCGGVSNKLPTVNHIIDSVSPVLLFISEAELSKDQTWVHINGYDRHSSDTLTYGRSRLICFSKSHSGFKMVKAKHDDVEVIILEDHQTRVAGIYRPFKHINGNTSSIYMNKLIETLTEAAKTKKKVYFAGDFNVSWIKKSTERTSLENWALSFGLSQMIKSSTWSRVIKVGNEQTIRRSLIDLVFSNDLDAIYTVEDNYTSDHNLVSIKTQDVLKEVHRTKIFRRNWNSYHPDAAYKDLAENYELQMADDLNGNVKIINDALTSIMDKHAPLRAIRLNRKTDIIDQKLEKAKKRRKRLRKKYNKEENADLKQRIANQVTQLNNYIKMRINTSRKNQIKTRLEGKTSRPSGTPLPSLKGRNLGRISS